MSTEQFTAEETAAMEDMRAVEVVEGPQPAPQPAPEPATPVEPEPKAGKPEEDRKPPDGFVPHGAMHEERKRRQEAEQELQALREQMAALKQPKPAEPEYVDPIADPEAHRKWTEHQIAKVAKEQQAFSQEYRQQQILHQRVSEAARLEQEFAARTPDYTEAATFLRDNRVQELRLMGWLDADIPQIIAQDANAMFDNARRNGKNPAEVLYQAAKMRGWSGKSLDSVTDADKVTALAKAQAATATIGAAAGGAAPVTYTMEMLAKMSEYDLAKLPADVKRKVLGG